MHKLMNQKLKSPLNASHILVRNVGQNSRNQLICSSICRATPSRTCCILREALDPIKNSKMRRGSILILIGLVSGGRPPEKLYQVSLHHASAQERPFACPLDDCLFSYRRKDHLTRHLLKHEGKTFTCPRENCNRSFAFQGNMKRHVKKLHDCEGESPVEVEKQYVCQEPRCGLKFKYASKLRKHEEMHAVKLDCSEVICCEPGCMKPFSNAECLRAHVQSCHKYVQCKICKTRQLKKNFKRHQRMHEESSVTEQIKCSFSGCLCTFSKKSNLNKHVKAVHQELRPFTCRISGCGQKFPYRHVRDNHENCGGHVFIQEDFLEADEQWLSRPHGGRKRRVVSSEDLMRKRIVPPGHASPLDDGTEYLRWLLADDQL